MNEDRITNMRIVAWDEGYNTALENAIAAIDTYQKRTWESNTNHAEALNALEEAKLIISKLKIK